MRAVPLDRSSRPAAIGWTVTALATSVLLWVRGLLLVVPFAWVIALACVVTAQYYAQGFRAGAWMRIVAWVLAGLMGAIFVSRALNAPFLPFAHPLPETLALIPLAIALCLFGVKAKRGLPWHTAALQLGLASITALASQEIFVYTTSHDLPGSIVGVGFYPTLAFLGLLVAAVLVLAGQAVRGMARGTALKA